MNLDDEENPYRDDLMPAYHLINQERFDEAKLLLTNLIEADSEDAEAMFLLTYGHSLENDAENTILWASRSLDHYPFHPLSYVMIADALIALENPLKARLAYYSAAILAPDSTLLWLRTHELAAACGDEQLAQLSLERAQALEPMNEDVLSFAGNWAFAQKRYLDAERIIGGLVLINPTNPLANANLGDALRLLGYKCEALVYYDRALELDPDLQDAKTWSVRTAFQVQWWRMYMFSIMFAPVANIFLDGWILAATLLALALFPLSLPLLSWRQRRRHPVLTHTYKKSTIRRSERIIEHGDGDQFQAEQNRTLLLLYVLVGTVLLFGVFAILSDETDYSLFFFAFAVPMGFMAHQVRRQRRAQTPTASDRPSPIEDSNKDAPQAQNPHLAPDNVVNLDEPPPAPPYPDPPNPPERP